MPLRSGSSRFTDETRAAAIDLEESFKRVAAQRRALRRSDAPSTGATPNPSRPNTPPLPPPSTGATPVPSRLGTPPLPDPPLIVAAVMTNFEDENADDGDAQALREACRNLERLVWDGNDVPFFFAQAEIKMRSVGVKKQYTKFSALASVLPKHVIDEVKEMVIMQESEFEQNNSYKLLKTEVLRIFGPKIDAGVNRVLSRVLVGPPSQLARALANDICKKKIKLKDCQCCPGVVLTLWKRQLSSSVCAGIAHCQFNYNTFNEVLQFADDTHASSEPAPVVAAVSGVARRPAPSQSLDETQPAIPYPQPEIAATSRGGQGGGRGRGRGGRGNRGGGAQGSLPQEIQVKVNTHPGTKHPDLPAGDWLGCGMHFKWGKFAFFCSEPSTCPWKNVCSESMNQC